MGFSVHKEGTQGCTEESNGWPAQEYFAIDIKVHYWKVKNILE